MLALRKRLGIRALVTVLLVVGFAGGERGLNLGGTPFVYAVMLGVGLFVSTYGIDLDAMRTSDWRVVTLAVTVCVFLKAAIIGFLLYAPALLFGAAGPIFFVLGIILAQMDPLAVAALQQHRRMSKRVDSLVRAVSSLDDPVTVLMVILLIVGQQVFGFHLGIDLASTTAILSMPEYGEYLYLNLAFMAVMVWFWQLAYKGDARWKLAFTIALIASAVVIGASWYWMLGLALLGLYIRPEEPIYSRLNEWLGRVAQVTFGATGVMAGCLLYGAVHLEDIGTELLIGAGLGLAAFVSQMISGGLVTMRGGYSRQDRAYFMCSHQNGLTAAMLAISTGTIAYVIPAIIVTHVCNAVAMIVLNRRYEPVSEEDE